MTSPVARSYRTQANVPTRRLLLTGPAAEPVSLVEAKSWLKIDTGDEDELLGALVTSARLIVESATRRLLLTQAWRLAIDAWPRGYTLEIPFAPARGVAAVRVYDAAGVATTMAPSLYWLDATVDGAWLRFNAPPPSPGRAAGIEIDVSVGYGDAPESAPAPLRRAILMLAARWFEDRGDPSLPVADAPLPATVMALIAPYRRGRLA